MACRFPMDGPQGSTGQRWAGDRGMPRRRCRLWWRRGNCHSHCPLGRRCHLLRSSYRPPASKTRRRSFHCCQMDAAQTGRCPRLRVCHGKTVQRIPATKRWRHLADQGIERPNHSGRCSRHRPTGYRHKRQATASPGRCSLSSGKDHLRPPPAFFR